jgi:cytochrome c553
MPDSSPIEPVNDHVWTVRAWLVAGAFVLASVVLGMLVLPARDGSKFDPFTVICRALGLPGYDNIPPDPGAARASPPVSDVVWDTTTQSLLNNARVARGAVLAKTVCGGCHGVDGKSTMPAQFPNLAGQSEALIFKELRDFRSGDRQSPFMQPIAQTLKDQQMADAAAYYSAQPASAVDVAAAAVPAKIVAIAREGDPNRAIPSCDSCHGANRDGPEDAPILLGQSVDYLEQQLKNFGGGVRHNDLFERMRTIAGQLTPQEKYDLARYYHGLAVPRP